MGNGKFGVWKGFNNLCHNRFFPSDSLFYVSEEKKTHNKTLSWGLFFYPKNYWLECVLFYLFIDPNFPSNLLFLGFREVLKEFPSKRNRLRTIY